MARIAETFNIGSVVTTGDNLNTEDLLLILERMYTDLAVAVNTKPDIVQRVNDDGQATDTFLAQGTININLDTNKVEMLTNHVNPTTVTWTQLSP